MNQSAAEHHIRGLLTALGEDVERDGLLDTPARVARMWSEFLERPRGRLQTKFVEGGDASNSVVTIHGLELSSMCEHHLLPMFLSVDVKYRPRFEAILGLSKFARLGQETAQCLQVQERFTVQMRDRVADATGSPDVAVKVTGVHTCMTWRGVMQRESKVFTAAGSGEFATESVDFGWH